MHQACNFSLARNSAHKGFGGLSTLSTQPTVLPKRIDIHAQNGLGFGVSGFRSVRSVAPHAHKSYILVTAPAKQAIPAEDIECCMPSARLPGKKRWHLGHFASVVIITMMRSIIVRTHSKEIIGTPATMAATRMIPWESSPTSKGKGQKELCSFELGV